MDHSDTAVRALPDNAQAPSETSTDEKAPSLKHADSDFKARVSVVATPSLPDPLPGAAVDADGLPVTYRLYRRRFVGLAALVGICCCGSTSEAASLTELLVETVRLEHCSGYGQLMVWPNRKRRCVSPFRFAPSMRSAAIRLRADRLQRPCCLVSDEFGFSLDEVNWLSNVVSLAFLPCSIIVPAICRRYGIRITVSCLRRLL